MSRVERHKSEYSKADREAVENIKPSDDPKDLDFTYGSKPEGRRAKAAADKKEAKAAPEKKAAKSGQKPKSRAERNASPDDDLGVWDQTEEEKKKARQEARAMGDGKPEFHAGRALGKLIGFIGTLILIVAIVACLALFVPHYAGIEQYPVTNGSMEPAIPSGSMVYTAQVDPSTLSAGDIIVFTTSGSGDTPVTSRVVENNIAGGAVITKGDANEQNDTDPAEYSSILGKKVLSVPVLGYLASPMKTILGKVAMGLVIVGAFILKAIGARLKKA